jgi:class 3 adenylate cyclase
LATGRVERRLAAILAADVAGYSRLIGVDEGGTLQAFKTLRSDLFEPTVATHNGRVRQDDGSGCLSRFGHVVDAPTPGDRSANAYGARAIREGLAGSTILDNLSARTRVSVLAALDQGRSPRS